MLLELCFRMSAWERILSRGKCHCQEPTANSIDGIGGNKQPKADGYNTKVSATTASPLSSGTSTSDRPYTVWQRFLLWLITWVGFLAIRLIGPTLRCAVSREDG